MSLLTKQLEVSNEDMNSARLLIDSLQEDLNNKMTLVNSNQVSGHYEAELLRLREDREMERKRSESEKLCLIAQVEEVNQYYLVYLGVYVYTCRVF